MALIDCPECGHKVSTEAAACPSCGKPTRLVVNKRPRSEPKKRGWPWAFLLLLLLAVVGFWGYANGWLAPLLTTKSDLEASVAQVMQEKFDTTPELKGYHLHVDHVTLIHSDGNRYKGMAAVSYNGRQHDVAVDVTADGDHIMYRVDPSSMVALLLGN